MKKFKLVIILLLFISLYSDSQTTKKSENLNLHETNLSIEAQIKIIKENILSYYGRKFKLYEQIHSGEYKFSDYIIEKNGYYLNIINTKDNKVIAAIKLKKLKKRNKKIKYSLDYIDFEKFLSNFNDKDIHSDNIHSPLQIIVRNNILWDKEILKHEDIPQSYWKILNKSFVSTYLENQNGEPASLYKYCRAGKIIPINETDSRVLTIDQEFNSLIYYNTNISEEAQFLNGYFGYGGNDTGQFFSPSGITIGREYVIDNGNRIYPIYIADYANSRVILVNYVLNNSGSELGYFDNSSFVVFKSIPFPSDLFYFKSSQSTDDKIWVSQTARNAALYCITQKGQIYQRIVGYKEESGQIYYFTNQQDEIRLGIYNDDFSSIAFIDKARNCIVTSLLDNKGVANVIDSDAGTLLLADEIVEFPVNEPLTSITFQRTSQTHSLWPYMWVTTSSYIHSLKMNASANVQYLASVYLPRNSDDNFSSLLNLIMTDDYYDLLTIENWNYSYGIRKYWPFCDIHSDSLYAYCRDSIDLIKFKGTFTNDCWIRLVAKRKKMDGNWENVKIKSLNGEEINDTVAIKWQLAGWNQASTDVYINIKLDLPVEDYILGGKVKIQLMLFPEYFIQT